MKDLLYSIKNEYLQAYSDLNDMEDMPAEAIRDTLEAIAMDFSEKAINVAAFIKNLEADAKSLQDMEDSVRKRKDAIVKKVASLNSYLLHSMLETNILDINTSPMFRIKVSNNPPSVVLLDESSIPERYKKHKTIETIDKASISKDIKAGVDVPGADLVINVKLSIK